jgi:transposase
MAIEWSGVATALEYPSEEEMWRDLYVTRGLSIVQIAKKLDVSRNTVRESLDRTGIVLRQRGGPNNQKLEITDALVEDIRREGITSVAKKLGLSYTTVYKRLYRVRGLTLADLELPEEPLDEVEDEEEDEE